MVTLRHTSDVITTNRNEYGKLTIMRLHTKLALSLAAIAASLLPTPAFADGGSNATTTDQYVGGNGVNSVTSSENNISIHGDTYGAPVPVAVLLGPHLRG